MPDLSKKHADGNTKWGLAGAIAAAVGASVCCLGPLLLLALGVGGAWIGNLTAMEKYRPIWMAATLVFLGLAFARVYRKPKEDACAPGSTCPPNAGRRNKVLLWIVTALVLGLLALPYAIPYAFAGGPEKPAASRGRHPRNVQGLRDALRFLLGHMGSENLVGLSEADHEGRSAEEIGR